MDIQIVFSEDPALALRRAGAFLASEPVLHNLILTLLHTRLKQPEPGRYWIALDRNQAAGVVLQSPPDFPATLTPMEPRVIAVMVDAIAKAGVSLPGINGDAATAANFAGRWTERRQSAATPFQGSRLYECVEVGDAPRIGGRLRQALPADGGMLIHWTHAFLAEIGERVHDAELRVERALAAGQLWLWDDDGPASMALSREPVEGVVRLAGVYTPADKRKRGYAGACVGALTKRLREAEYRCVLYTDLGNPTSNSIYRRIGYKAVAEALRYRFG
ncbi:MAG: GNAT family N-acetyltransferase [Bryobacteraceae bacterium]